VQNYPFCTIDPNVGVIEVPDDRLKKLSDISHSGKIIAAVVEFVDIAGLVKGASEGEGLGNQFLAHIREVDAIVHVVRDFKDDNIIHVAGSVNPEQDQTIINFELALADLATVTKALERVTKQTKGVPTKDALRQKATYEIVHKTLSEGSPVRGLELTEEQKFDIRDLHLLTAKPMLYVVNVAENDPRLKEPVTGGRVYVCARMEADMVALSEEEALEYRKELGLQESGLNKLVRAGYTLLDLVTFFTTGEMETRAWTITRGTLAPQAAGVIHTDFEKAFIRAEVIAYEDFVAGNGEAGAKINGKFRIEGKEYVVQDGDVCHFRVNA
jgi:GTP-binding protein YchF